MLREATVHTMDWCEMTMSVIRERQLEACEKRLADYPRIGLFSEWATDADAQGLYDSSYYALEGTEDGLVTLDALRRRVLALLPQEACYLSVGETGLLERLLLANGRLPMTEWEDVASAEALASRLWCHFELDDGLLHAVLCEALIDPILEAMSTERCHHARELIFRFDATIQGLLYIAGFLHSAQPMGCFLQDVMGEDTRVSRLLATRYLKASYEYIPENGRELILLHPGLADPYRLITQTENKDWVTLELSRDMVTGGMSGLFPEEEAIHADMWAALQGALRPELDEREAAEDLRMLAKQGVALWQMEEVLSSMLSVLPTQRMLDALKQLYERTPHWIGLQATLQH